MDEAARIRTVKSKDEAKDRAKDQETPVLVVALGTGIRYVRPGLTVIETLREANLLMSLAGGAAVIRVGGVIVPDPARRVLAPGERVTVTRTVKAG